MHKRITEGVKTIRVLYANVEGGELLVKEGEILDSTGLHEWWVSDPGEISGGQDTGCSWRKIEIST